MTQNWQYKIGFSTEEFEKIKEAISKKGLEYIKVKVEDVLKETIPLCLNAVYKNPSSMRFDAPNAFSCSSLISYLYTQAGVWMPSLSIDKYVYGTPITKEELKFGDLVFSNTGIGKIRFETVEYLPGTKVPEGVDHVVFYLGNDEILHATKRYGGVVKEYLKNLENISKIVGFRRVANIDEERFVVIVPNGREDLRKSENLIKEIIQ
ncbi:MAG: hypothetical protein A2431_01000 [Candidatus Zambryskibacteria bacterium RIFOXYC1_FULL_39_10]|uniref:NlpC/P60 domain-containing protein n=1 Tax=Candidatus Zambryskibacteria bacterium RIFOXYC1_FULL_39_10 TaxID=1802779 RepID=A0A1G2V2I2_9BACT|nr:MAG: hypothetical protein A2431_01000 [Candidatus Zambryskibacteria bacterium RIFOXYC1_FULL_39_10]OHB16877.1 MAG: hypothetical protein A2605_00210 [Candidatus Zambryskibacteria bacterium RIFOXYD1_FULL_39_35]